MPYCSTAMAKSPALIDLVLAVRATTADAVDAALKEAIRLLDQPADLARGLGLAP